MTVESESLSNTPAGSGRSFNLVLLVVGVAACMLAIVIRSSSQPKILEPTPAPEFHVEGWLNGPGPTIEEMKGKVIVVDAWAYWCRPCIAKAPELIALYEHYKGQDVLFVGLTAEGQAMNEKSLKFLADTKIPWPNGYGASRTLLNLNNDYIPQTWVFDRKYNLIWDEARSTETIEAAINRALAEKP